MLDTPVIVRGYNPQSWSTIGDYKRTQDIADRTAFDFDLTQSLLFRQRTDDLGILQTYNAVDHSPTFGGDCSGDLAVYGDLSQG
ncbi:MAG TPA: hypothetical protein PKC97_17585 [Burkholderiaceae bacterium]|nr:hypothetical protein [Burkholderiaceae bacterium]